jgi:hypothetical protein
MANAVDGAGSANNCQHRQKSSVEDDLYPVHSTFYRPLRPRHVARLLRETDRAVQLTKPTTLSWDYMRGALTYKWSLPRRIHFPESARIVNLGSDHSPVALGR